MRSHSILVAATCLAVGAAGALLAPPATAVWSPNKTSTITIEVDGLTLGIDDSVQDMSTTRQGIFGGGNQPSSGSSPDTGDLTEMYASKDGAFVNFEARGGIVAVSCSGSGTLYYRRAQVTVGNLPSGNNRVWALYDPSVGPSIGAPTPHFNDNASRITSTGSLEELCDDSTLYVSGTPGELHLGNDAATPSSTGRTTAGVYNDTTGTSTSTSFEVYVPTDGSGSGTTENFIALGIVVDAGRVTSTVSNKALTGNVATLTTSSAHGLNVGQSVEVSGVDSTFNGTQIVTAVPTTTTFEFTKVASDVASVSSSGTVVSGLDDATDDTAIFTHVVSKPWESSFDVLLSACSSPAASDSACYVEADTGVFAADGTTRIGTTSQFSVVGSFYSQSGEAVANAAIGFTSAQTDGFSIPANSIVKFSISLPTTGTVHGIDFAASRMFDATGQTGLLVDPRTTSPSSATNRWDITTVSDRDIASITGVARATSSAISRSAWYSNCQITFSGSSVSTVGCGEGMTSSVSTDYMVFTTVPADFSLAVINDSVMRTVAGGLISTNAQNLQFGPETMTGTSFQFAVAGPSYDASDNSRSTDGFYYVCVPDAFLSGSFGTTAADASTSWIGTRDGSTVSTSFSTGTCGTSAGLVAYLDPFGYSAPVFSLRPPSAPSSGGSSGSSGSTTTTMTTTTTTTITAPAVQEAPVTPAAAPAITPALPTVATGKALKPAYLTRLATLAGLKGATASTVRITVPKMYRSVCSVKAGTVVAKKGGLCGVKVAVKDPKTGKVRAKRVYLTVE